MRVRLIALAATGCAALGMVAAAAPAGAVGTTAPRDTTYHVCILTECPGQELELDGQAKTWGSYTEGYFEPSYHFVQHGTHVVLREGECSIEGNETPSGDIGEPGATLRVTCGGEQIPVPIWLEKVGEVGGALTLTPKSLGTIEAARPYHAVFTAAAGTGPYTFQLPSSLPEGLSWNTASEAAGTIELTGTPTKAGSYWITVDAHDAAAPASTIRREYLLNVELYLSGGLGKATAGQPYSHQLTTAGGIEPYIFLLEEGSLPEGLELSESGLISGTPAHAGRSTVEIGVVDAGGHAHFRTYTLEVDLGLTPAKLPLGEVGTPYGEGSGVPIEVTGGSAPYSLEAEGELPAGLKLEDGSITGTPETEGVYSFTVRASDPGIPGIGGSHRYTIKVKHGNGGLTPGAWRLGYKYSAEELNEYYDGVTVENGGRLHDEDGAPGTYSFPGGHLVFTLEVSRGNAITYTSTSGSPPNGPFSGTWGSFGAPFTLTHE